MACFQTPNLAASYYTSMDANISAECKTFQTGERATSNTGMGAEAGPEEHEHGNVTAFAIAAAETDFLSKGQKRIAVGVLTASSAEPNTHHTHERNYETFIQFSALP